jgi:uncharacterized protein (TIGR02300 family)
MPKPEWGTKRTCPKTGERFYDLGRDNPVVSPCGYEWYPEPVLKSKQPIPFEDEVKKKKDEPADSDLASDDLADIEDIEDDDATADADVDLDTDDDLGISNDDDENEHES